MADWTQLDLLLGRQYQSLSIDPLLENNPIWYYSNPEIGDESRLVARWFSSHNCIKAQMNGRTKRAIYE